MTLYRGTPILWVQDFNGKDHNPEIERGKHGPIWIGTIQRATAYGKRTDEWEWGMVVTGKGRDRMLCNGVSETKKAAEEACNACYIALMEIDGNYEAAVARYEELDRSTQMFEERRVQFGPVDESRGW